MTKWIPKKEFLTSVTLVALLSVIIYFAGLFFVLGEVREIEDVYRNTESEFSKNEKARTLKSLAESNKEDIQTLREFFIQKGDEIEFIEKIEEIGRKSGTTFEIDSINPKLEQGDILKENIEVRINIEGSWSKIMNFIDMLEKTYFGVSIQNINLDINTPGQWSGFIEFIIFREK